MKYKGFINTISTDDFGGFNAIEYADGGLEYYVSVQAVLKWIGEYANLISNGSEIIHVDWESDKPMFMYSTTLSCDLAKCYVRNAYLRNSRGTFNNKSGIPSFKNINTFEDIKYASLNQTLKEEAGTIEDTSIYPQVGNINYIYLSTYHLSQLITKGSDNKDNKITIRKFLQDICDGMNKALGSINDFQVISNVDGIVENLTIIDYQQKRIKGLAAKFKEADRNTTTLQTQGLGTMLTKIQAQSSITPELAGMIAIGAQAQNQPVGEEAASFSLLSKGFTDRIYPSKTIGDTDLVKQEKERKEAIESKYETALSAYANLLSNQQPAGEGTFNPVSLKSTEVSNLQNIAVELYKACLGMFTETGQTSTAFIPIKINLSLYGISGIKIYQKFKLSNNVLPLSYKGNFEFVVLGVSHTVDSSRWETNISALITLADESLKKDGPLKPFSVRANKLTPGFDDAGANPEDFPNVAKPDGWPFYSDSDAVPDNVAPPSSAKAPSSSRNIRPNKYIRNEYLPILNKAKYSRGLKMLALTMTQQEGFYPKTKSYQTNNPGNIGNTDAGGTNKFKTLKAGIDAQLSYVERVALGTHPAYPKGETKTIEPYFSPEIARNAENYQLNPYLPGYKFKPYTGTLEQFVKIYATGARGGNTYLSTIISFFKKNGDTITPKTKLEDINKITGTKDIIV